MALDARVACRTAWTMLLISTLGIGAGGRKGFAWGAKTMGAGATKAVLEEITGEVWSQDFS